MSVSIEGNKILSFYNDAKKLIKGEMVVPRFVSMWLTTACQLSCSYCFFSNKNKEKVFANTYQVEKFITELSRIGVESIEFSGGGEPTLHKDCFNIIEYGSKKGLKVGLLTNGFKFDYNKINYLSYIRIGLDAHTPELYTKIKGGSKSNFNETVDNIKMLVNQRKRLLPRIGIKFMLNSINVMYLNDMVEFAKSLGVDYCHFKSTHTDAYQLTNSQMSTVHTILTNLKNLSPNFVFGSVIRNKAKVKCFMSPIHTVITPNGDCLVCCYHYQSQYIIGNVFKDGFVKVWCNKKHRDIINSIQISDCSKVDCRFLFYNNEMKDVIENNKYDISFI